MVAKLTSSFLIQERKWRETELEKARSKARAEEEVRVASRKIIR